MTSAFNPSSSTRNARRIALLTMMLLAVTACGSEERAPSLAKIDKELPTYLSRYPGVERGQTQSCIELKIDFVRSVKTGLINAADGLADRSVDYGPLRNGEAVYFEGIAGNVKETSRTGSDTLFSGTLQTAGSEYGLIFRSSSAVTNNRVNEGLLMKGGANSPMLTNEGAHVCGFGIAMVAGRLNGILVADAIEFTPN